MFNVFIEFPKPIIAAVNGPGIGGNLRRSNGAMENVKGLGQQLLPSVTPFLPPPRQLFSHLSPGEQCTVDKGANSEIYQARRWT